MLLLYIYILWMFVCVEGEESVMTVSAPVGSTAVLPCSLTENFTETSVIQWFVHNAHVLERSSDGMHVFPQYKNRVNVTLDDLRKGNCSLVLKDVRITDDGYYKTFWVKHFDKTNESREKPINRVQLSVVFQKSAEVGSTVLLPCDWSNLSIQTHHVEWYIKSETVFWRKGNESFQGKEYEGRVDVPKDQLLKGNCSLVLKNVSVNDTGNYTSYIIEEDDQKFIVQKVELLVVGDSDNNSFLEQSDGISKNRNHYFLFITLILILVTIIWMLYKRKSTTEQAVPSSRGQPTESYEMAVRDRDERRSPRKRKNTTSDSETVGYEEVSSEPQS